MPGLWVPDGETGMMDTPRVRYATKRYEARRYCQYFRIKPERLDRNGLLKDKPAIIATVGRWFKRCFTRREVNFLMHAPSVTEWQHGNTGEIVVCADVYVYEGFPEDERVYIAGAAMRRPMQRYVEVFQLEPPNYASLT